ncbi:MAG: DUF1318 domain-containing protein [Opitutus sp.]|nr:DUF1318 domain-containing protein [Opitutus sp.]
MKSTTLVRLLSVFAVLALGPAVVCAQNLAAVKARIEERIGSVNALKDRRVIGENNRGYLEAREGAVGAEQQIISDENADRRTVYAALAAQTGATADAVGRQRAHQIATLAKRGHWIQEQNGGWHQKG